MNQDDRILMVGCGNSKLSEQMYESNYQNIVNIDISEVIINKMKEQCKETCPKMEFFEMDATNMKFPDNEFDFIIDKGTLDALMCAEDDEIPIKLVQEMFRVTKPGKYFSVISHGGPDERNYFFSEALPITNYKYEIISKKISLSFMSNLINSIRSNKKDASLSDAVKNKETLMNSILDVCISKLEEPGEKNINELSETEKDKLEQRKQKLLSMKVLKLLYKKKTGQLDDDSDKPNKTQEDDIENKENEKKPNIRRSHCFLYLIKKIN
jgi:ubiquinone/menaquinone biosynthesis C-methylase UbiE